MARLEDMAEWRTLLKDEHLNPKIEPFDQRSARKPLSSDNTFAKSSTIYSINQRDLNFHLMPVRQPDIWRCFVNESQRSGWVKALHSTRVWLSDSWLPMYWLAWFLVVWMRTILTHSMKLCNWFPSLAHPLKFKQWFFLGGFQLLP